MTDLPHHNFDKVPQQHLGRMSHCNGRGKVPWCYQAPGFALNSGDTFATPDPVQDGERVGGSYCFADHERSKMDYPRCRNLFLSLVLGVLVSMPLFIQ